ncbi:MAG: acyl carrier protein [Magnetococcales bacterium]|nr:acyl carrier protein [Magnetococcales bacterium]
MTEEKIYQVLTPIFRDVFDDPQLEVTRELCADDVPEWDSLSNIQMVVAVEQHFKIRFTTQELSSNRHVGDFVAMILAKITV